MMMEAMERLVNRRAAADANRYEAPIVKKVEDIQRVLRELDPTNKLNTNVGDVKLHAQVDGKDERGAGRVFSVDAVARSKTHRDILLDGFSILQSRKDVVRKIIDKTELPELVVNDKEMPPPDVIATEDAALAIDPIIKRLLGGHRCGRYICWDLSDGFTYKYEIFEHRLTRVLTHESGSPASGPIPRY